ncbi:MAG TPA: RHS repeat-associated core domain-containing protein [Vicinamibacteria bacterium]
MNTLLRQRPEGRTRWTHWIAVTLLCSTFLGVATAVQDPTPPVKFKGVLRVSDATSPPESTSVGIHAYSLSHGFSPRMRILNTPLELDKQFNGELCWDAFCREFLDPPPFDVVEFTGSLFSHGTYFCETGPTLCPVNFRFYFHNSDIVSCPNSGCLKEIDVGFYSRFGTVKGSVRLRDGTPAIGKTVLAKDPEGKLKPVTTSTNQFGLYDFSATFAPVEPDHEAYGKVFPPVPLDPDNNWGLTVYGDGNWNGDSPETFSRSQGQKEWLVGVSPTGPVVNVNVRGGEAALAHFTISLEDDDDPDKQDCWTVGEPVSIMTGNVFFSQTDVVMNDLRGPFTLVRTYNSQNAYFSKPAVPRLFGPGWSHSYESRLYFPTSFRGVVLSQSNGVPIFYTDPEDDGSYHAYLPLTERSWVVRSGGSYTRFLLDGSRELYDAEGRLIEQVDASGGVTELEYEGGRLSRVRAPGGRALSFSYGSDAIYLAGPEGVVATYRFEVGRLDRVEYPDGSGFQYTYDDEGQLLVMLDATGRVVERHAYVEGKAVTSEIGEGQERFTFQYEPGRTVVTDPLGNESVYEFGQIHEDKVLTRVTGPCSVCGGSGQVREWTYDALARVVTFTDGPGHVTSYTYDAQGNVLTETNPANETTTFTYDAQGRVLNRLDPDGALTTFTYGPFGILSMTDPLQRTTTVEYDARGLRRSIRDAGDGLFTLTHNELGDLTSVTDPLGRSVRYEYDDMGRRVLVGDTMGNTSRFSYDARWRLQKVTRGDGSSIEITYDAAGRRSSVSDALGGRTSYLYDGAGRLERIVDSLNGVVTLAYDSMSNVTSFTDQRGHVTRFEYDAFRRVTRITYPDDTFQTFVYDEAGHLESQTDRKGTLITFLSDPVGRLLGETYSDGTPSVSYAYDAAGRLARAENDADTLTWTYDLAGQLSNETSARNHSSVAYTYDPLGNRVSVSLDGDLFASYEYDATSRLRSITYGADVFRFEHDDALRRTRSNLPNGVTTTYGYDPASRLAHITATSGTDSVSAADYAYDLAGRVTERSTDELTETYSYDALGRLSSVDRTGSDLGHWAYAFDAAGNRTSAMNDRNVTTSTYNARNELEREDPGGPLLIRGELDEPGTVEVNGEPAALLADNRFETTVNVPGETSTVEVTATDGSGNVRTHTYEVDVDGTRADFQYDANGNLIERAEGATTWNYEWNGENQLTRVLGDGVEVARFAYDPLGRRVQKTTALAATAYTYADTRILRETSVPGDTIRYIHGPEIDEPLAADRGGELTFFHLDALGSVVGTTNANGERTSSIRYDAFGNPEEDISSGYAYTGREWDAETGLYYYRARYYDPRTGRFISEDPIGFGDGPNLYAYVAGDPINRRDPSGTSWVHVGLGALEVLTWLYHAYEFAHCNAENAECNNTRNQVCRCNDLDAGAKADCVARVWNECHAESLRCYGGLAAEIIAAEGVFGLASKPVKGVGRESSTLGR